MFSLNEITENDWQHIGSIFSGVNGVIIIDDGGIIRYCSEDYHRLAGAVIGQRVDEVFHAPPLLRTLATGNSVIAESWEINGKPQIMSCWPMLDDNHIIGVLGLNIFANRREAAAFIRSWQPKLPELRSAPNEGKQLVGAKYSLDAILGESEGIIEARERVKIIADSNVPVLIQGDTGTGKELIAHALHQESNRRKGPFIRVNCAGIPESLLESELFGYEEGAFTGARKGGKPGKFELANHGSIFLDEISELSITAQAKLLRTLQENEIERVGSTRIIPIDARVISASNQPLTRLVEEGHFRKDLMFRLAVFTIYIPPLRERPEDIRLLSHHFVDEYNREHGTDIEGISNEAMDFLLAYHWPGNVRELMIAIERACLDAHKGFITMNNVLRYLGIAKGQFLKNYSYPGFNLKMARQEAEKATIRNALQASEGNRQQAAKLLGISRSALYNKMAELDIIE